MLAIFSKNCVLMGDLDSYCLVCSVPVTGDVLGLEHIRSPEHNAKLKRTVYFEKYKDDLIKKVNGVYFCEVCNKTFATAGKVGIHVTEETHIKGIRRQLTRVGTSVIFQKDTLIEECAWNGLVDDTCVVCNVEIDDYSTHMSEHSHALNVVRSPVTIDDDNNIYRKVDGCFVDEVDYQCLTCNNVVSNTEISKHLDSEQHKAARVSIYCTRNDAYKNNIDQRNEEKKEQMKENEANGDDTKVTSNEYVDTKLTDNPPVTQENVIKTEELEAYAKEHGLFVTQDRFYLNCQISSTVHTDNIKRQAEADKEGNIMKIEKVLPKDYVKEMLTVDCRFVIINDSIYLARKDIERHVFSPSHKYEMRKAFVITSLKLKEELVRQINSEYQCGYCGFFQEDFGDMLDHLASPVHAFYKSKKKDIFQIIKKELLNHRLA